MPEEKIHEIGEGRLWLGMEAADRGLVDESGGLYDAIAHARDIIKAKKVRIYFLPRQPYLFRLIARKNASTHERAGVSMIQGFTGSDGPGLAERALSFFLPGSPAERVEPGQEILSEITDACLSFHGRPLFLDPSLLQFLPGPGHRWISP